MDRALNQLPLVQSPSLNTDVAAANADGILGRLPANILKDLIGTVANLLIDSADLTTNPGAPQGNRMWVASEVGTYTNFGGLVISTGEIAFLVDNGTSYTKVPIPIDTSDFLQISEVSEAATGTSGKNLFRPDLVQTGKFINSLGDVGNRGGARAVIGQPVTAGSQYTISGYPSGTTIYAQFLDNASTKVGSPVDITTGYPAGTTVTAPAGATTVRYTLNSATTPDVRATIQWELGTSATAYEPPYTTGVFQILDKILIATFLSAGNSVPDPVTRPNAVNKGYFDDHAVTDQDFTLIPGKNLFNPEWIINDQFVGSTGAISSGAGWKMIRVPVTAGEAYTFQGIGISSGGYSAFYQANGTTMVAYNGSFTSTNQPRTYTAPAGSAYLYIDIKRPADADTVYAEASVVQGSVPLDPYEPYGDLISEIKGYRLVGSQGGGGGELPTDPVFNSVTANSADIAALTVAAMTLDLPTGAGTPPGGVEIGDAWIDTSAGNAIKVRTV